MDIYEHCVNLEQNIKKQWQLELMYLLNHAVLNENTAISSIMD